MRLGDVEEGGAERAALYDPPISGEGLRAHHMYRSGERVQVATNQ